jgi:hypothetical protein
MDFIILHNIRKAIGLLLLVVFLAACSSSAGESPTPTVKRGSEKPQLASTPTERPQVTNESFNEIQTTSTPNQTPPPYQTSVLYGTTYHRPDGNRFVQGSGSITGAQMIDIPLDGNPEWLVAAPARGGSLWVVILQDGRGLAFHVSGDGYRQVDISPEQVPPGLPPLLQIKEGIPSLVMAPAADASPLTHPVVLGEDHERIVYLANNGDLVIWDGEESARLAVNGLPDARILVDERQRLLLLTDPTGRYDHGVLGDDIEAGSITLVETQPVPKVVQKIIIEPPSVIEGIAPMWVDITGDGMREIIVTRSDVNQGAQTVVFDEDGGEVATGPAIGRGYRWRNQLAVASFGPHGELEFVDVLTPHIGGVVEFFRLSGGFLDLVAQQPGFTSHVIGTRNLDMALAGDFDGDGYVEVLLPTQDRSVLGAIRRTMDGAQVVWSLPVGGIVSTNLTAVSFPGGGIAVGVGREDGVLRVWVP